MSAPSRDAEALERREGDEPDDTHSAVVTGDAGDTSDGGDPSATTEPVEEAADDVDGSDGDEAASAPGDDDLAAAVAPRDAYLEDLQRVTAEFANFRRQTAKRNTETQARAALKLVEQLMPVLDACEAAASQGVEGIEAVQSLLLGVLGADGLTVLGAIDEPFDPKIHEAAMRDEPADGDPTEPVVAEVLRTGYAWHGRVLRPATVKVRG